MSSVTRSACHTHQDVRIRTYYLVSQLLVEFSENVLTRSTGAGKATYWLALLVPLSAILLFAFNGPFSSLDVGGLIQRLYWLVFTAWLIFKAQQLLPNRVPASARP